MPICSAPSVMGAAISTLALQKQLQGFMPVRMFNVLNVLTLWRLSGPSRAVEPSRTVQRPVNQRVVLACVAASPASEQFAG